MKFRFPIVIIDEDFRSENSSGLGIRALAQAFPRITDPAVRQAVARVVEALASA